VGGHSYKRSDKGESDVIKALKNSRDFCIEKGVICSSPSYVKLHQASQAAAGDGDTTRTVEGICGNSHAGEG